MRFWIPLIVSLEVGRTKHFKLVLPKNGPATKALQEFIRHVATSRPAEEIFNSHLISGRGWLFNPLRRHSRPFDR